MNISSFFKKAAIAIGCLPFFAAVASAQVDVTASGGTATAPYTTLLDAFAAINAGTHTGIITIGISGNTTETSSAVLNASDTGSASYTRITVSPTGGAARTITGAFAAPIIILNGADSVVIDGLDTGGNALIISNSSAIGGPSSALRFIADATGNKIIHCTMTNQSTSTTSGVVTFSTGSVTGNNYDTISHCTITGTGTNLFSHGVYSLGTSLKSNSNNLVTNCRIYDYNLSGNGGSGMYITSNNQAWTISSNRIYQTTARSYSTTSAGLCIYVNSGNGYTIANNIIGYASDSGTGVYTMSTTGTAGLVGIQLNTTAGTATSVQGNIISGIKYTTASVASTGAGALCGISVSGAGSYDIGTVTGNIIGTTSGTDSLTVVPASGGAIVGIRTGATGIVAIQNNKIGALSAHSVSVTANNGIMGISCDGVAALLTISNNIIGNQTANNMTAGTSATTTGTTTASGIILRSMPTKTLIAYNTVQGLKSYASGAAGFTRGIWTLGGTGTENVNIIGDTVRNIASNSSSSNTTDGQTAVLGINVNWGTNDTIRDNVVYNLSSLYTGTAAVKVIGISMSFATNTRIFNNIIYGLSNAGTGTTALSPPLIAGILIRAGTTAMYAYNNMISLGNGQTSNTCFVGIHAYHGTTANLGDSIYFNTVNIEGTVTLGALPSFCFLRSDFSATAGTVAVDVRNNIFTNIRTGGIGLHYAIGNNYGAPAATATGWGANASNYNILNANDTTIGLWGTNKTFSAWKIASGSDANSYSGVAVNYVNSASNLHLKMGTNATVIESGGVAVPGYGFDIDGQARPGPVNSIHGGGTAPDMGADEFDGVPTTVPTWTGATNTDWNTADNWKNSTMPLTTEFAVIPLVTNQPVIGATNTVAGLEIATGATISVSTGAILNNTGTLGNNGAITGTGKLTLNGSTPQAIVGTGSIANLELANSAGATIGATSADTLKLTGLLTLTSGTLTTNNKLILKSTSPTATAMVGPVLGAISGNVIHERYLSAPANGSGGRSWRLLTSPVGNNATDKSIFYHWQNNGINNGIGVELWGPGGNGPTGNGLLGGGSSASIRSFDYINNAYIPVTNTKTTMLFNGTTNNTFMAFISGSYGSGNINFGSSGATNLHATGTLITGTQNYSFTTPSAANKYYLMGNPYACPVDFDKVYHNAGTANINQKFWVIDPNLSNVGAYVTVSYVSSSYVTSVTSNQNQYIQTGQGFFVEAATPNILSTVAIEESNKETSAAQTSMFRTNGGSLETFRVKLYKDINSTATLLDGTVVAGHQNNDNGIDGVDGIKFSNFNENIGVMNAGKVLSIDARQLLDDNDTVNVSLSSMQQSVYQLVIEPGNMSASGLYATLIDHFANTTTPVSLSANTTYSFTVTSSPTSTGTGRFSVVFNSITPLALKFINTSAIKHDDKVDVQWTVASQEGINIYEVERSRDAKSFTKIATTTASANNNYSYTDEAPLNGNNYYRIKAIARSSNNGVYSNIVRVNMNSVGTELNVYPNPVKDGQLQVSVSNLEKGVYTISLYNVAGQKAAIKQLSYEGGSNVIDMDITSVAPGIYMMHLVNENGETIAEQKIVKQYLAPAF